MENTDTQENKILDLVEDVATWLVTASPEDILSYSKTLPAEFLQESSMFWRELLHTIRFRRNKGLTELLHVNIDGLMSESAIILMITNFSCYNAESVIQRYKDKYPSLTVGVLDPSITTWSREQIDLWNNVFLLGNARKVNLYVAMYRLLSSAQLDPHKLKYYLDQTQKTLKDFAEKLESRNFEKTFFPVDLQQNVKTLLESYKVFTEEYINNLVKVGSQKEIFELLTRVEYVLRLLKIEDLETSLSKDEKMLQKNIWRQLAIDAKLEEMSQYDRKWNVNNARVNDSAGDLYKRLSEVVNPEQVIDGRALAYLKKYVEALNPSQKTIFFEEFQSLILELPEFGAAFDAIDPDFLFKRMQEIKTLEERMVFVDSLQKSVMEEEWPLIKQLFLLIANLYS